MEQQHSFGSAFLSCPSKTRAASQNIEFHLQVCRTGIHENALWIPFTICLSNVFLQLALIYLDTKLSTCGSFAKITSCAEASCRGGLQRSRRRDPVESAPQVIKELRSCFLHFQNLSCRLMPSNPPSSPP